MRRLGLCVSLLVALNGCGSSGGGGTGGSGGGTTGTGGTTTGTGGAAGKSGSGGSAGGHAGSSASGGAGGGTAGAGGGAGATATGGAGGGLTCGDATGSGTMCNTITGTATGPCVVTTMSSGTAPTPGGGTVGNGTYELTSSTFYGTLPEAGSNNDGDFSTRRETFVVYLANSTSFTLDQFQAEGTQNNSEQGTVTISGTTVTYVPTCPAPGDGGNNGGSANYTATSSAFTLILSKTGGTLVRVYTKISGGGGTGGSAGTNGGAGAGGSAGSSAGGHAGGGAGGGSTGTGGTSGGAGAGGSAGTSGGAGNGGAGGAPACGTATGPGDVCNTISGSATGPCVVTTMSANTAPTALGGSVLSGTYQLTSSTFYGTLPDGAASSDGDFGTHQETFLVYVQSATSFNLDQFKTDGSRNDVDQGTVTISGTTVTYTQTCPAPGDGGNSGGSAGFTSDGTTFTVLISKDGGILVKVYTKTS